MLFSRLIFLVLYLMPAGAFAAECDALFAAVAQQEQPSWQALNRWAEAELKEYLNLYAVPRVSVKEVKRQNKLVLQHLAKMPISVPKGRRAWFAEEELAEFYRDLVEHKLLKSHSVHKDYDPDCKIGFCFGRAMAVHLHAVKAGLHKSSIRKIWAVGKMNSGSGTWTYHVATMVRGPEGRWMVIDPLIDRPVSPEKWYQHVKSNFSTDSRLRIFSTEAKRFGPESPGAYYPRVLSDPFYNGYFEDVMKGLKEELEPPKE